MFGPLADNRHSLLLIAGLMLTAAYVAGGSAVAEGLSSALVEQAERLPDPPRLAFAGLEPWAAPLSDIAVPAGAAILRVSRTADVETQPWVVASVVQPGAGLERDESGLGRNVARANVTFPESIDVGRVVGSEWFPRGWILLNATDFNALANDSGAPTGEVLLLPPGVSAPDGLTVVPLATLPQFVLSGGESIQAAFLLLVAGSSLVALVLAGSLTVGAVQAHRRELHILRCIGASRRQVRRILLAWLSRVIAVGIAGGASLGVVLAYAFFSLGNRMHVRAPVVPSPDAPRLLLALGVLALAALIAGLWAGDREAARQQGQLPEAEL